MAKIDETVFTVQIKAVNTILQLCYTLKDYVKSLIEQGNGNIDDISTINAHLLILDNEITQITSDINNLTNNITSINSSITSLNNDKLDKVSNATEIMQAYIKQPDGSQQMCYVHWNNVRDTIPIRDQTGNIRVAMIPTTDTHATSKKYVDDAISGIIPYQPKYYFHDIELVTNRAKYWIGVLRPTSSPITRLDDLFNAQSEDSGLSPAGYKYIAELHHCLKLYPVSNTELYLYLENDTTWRLVDKDDGQVNYHTLVSLDDYVSSL